MHGIAIPHAVISSAARNLFRPSFPSSFAKPFTGNTVHLSAIRCFPFLAVKHAPSYRQRKRSLDFARDDDTRNAPFPLPVIRCFPFLAVRHSPSCRQRKRPLDSARDDDTGRTRFPHILCMMYGIAIPHAVISSVARNLFRPSFPTTPSLSRLRKAPSAFPRYGVSHFSPSDALRLTANEKDPSTSLGMTIRETSLFHFPRYGVSVSCYQTCTINKRAMNACVHGSFTCGKTGSHLPRLICSSAGSPSGTHSFPFSHPHYREGGRHSGKASHRRCIPG